MEACKHAIGTGGILAVKALGPGIEPILARAREGVAAGGLLNPGTHGIVAENVCTFASASPTGQAPNDDAQANEDDEPHRPPRTESPPRRIGRRRVWTPDEARHCAKGNGADENDRTQYDRPSHANLGGRILHHKEVAPVQGDDPPIETRSEKLEVNHVRQCRQPNEKCDNGPGNSFGDLQRPGQLGDDSSIHDDQTVEIEATQQASVNRLGVWQSSHAHELVAQEPQ